MAITGHPAEHVVAINDGLLVTMGKKGDQLRLIFKFDRDGVKGSLILEEAKAGLAVLCPEIHPDKPVALLNLGSTSSEGREIPGQLTLEVELYNPQQVLDPFAQARYIPSGISLRLKPGVSKLKPAKTSDESESDLPNAPINP